MKAGRELDALVAEKVLGWRSVGGWYYIVEDDDGCYRPTDWYSEPQISEFESHPYCMVFAPSTSIASAWEVVEKLYGLQFVNGQACALAITVGVGNTVVGEEAWCTVREMSPMGYADTVGPLVDVAAKAETAPLAICLAALAAVGVEVPA